MSKITLSYVLTSSVCLLTLILFSCNNDEKLGPAPIITSFSPNSGIIGTHVTIIGNHFILPVTPPAQLLTNTSIVKFNGTIAEAERVDQDSVDKQEIYTSVPAGATSGKITVTANGITAVSHKDFIVTVPTYLPNVTVTTVASYGGLDVTIDTDGNLYVTNNDHFEIVKIGLDGTITTLLSTVNDTNRGIPMGITVDTDGNVYATVGNTIRKIFPDGTVIVLAGSAGADFGYADGQGAEAQFSIPWGITVNASGIVYVADFGNYKIRKILPDGTVSTLAGSTPGYADGQGANSLFRAPIDVEVDKDGNIFVADAGNHKIRKITPDGNVTTVAGSTIGYYDGLGTSAQFNSPRGITVDGSGNVYVSDSDNFVVRKIAPDGTVVTVAGSTFGSMDGPGASAQFGQTQGITLDASGALYLTQGGGLGGIRKIVIN